MIAPVPIAVIDIDGVLANAAHREHFVTERPKDWDGFFAAVGEDSVIERGRALLEELAVDHEIVLLSGRPERTRADTEAWLAHHGIRYARLVLRPDSDRRPAAAFKAQALPRIGAPDVVVVMVDDDERVVAAVQGLGYSALLFE